MATHVRLTSAPAHHLPGGGFRNPPGSPRQDAGLRDFLAFFLSLRRAKLPPLPAGLAAPAPPDLAALEENELAWLGHACFALRLGGKLVLTDPYLSRTAGPFGLGPRRFLDAAVTAEALPKLDAIVISHNHYDHLDTRALGAYRWRGETPVVCPLGLAPLLRRQGFPEVIELDWWQSRSLGDLTLTCLPAVHFSGRGLRDRNRTLWASFALASPARKVWFGGDTALGAVFREIGERAGPFDLALVGIGAYEPRAIMKAKPRHARGGGADRARHPRQGCSRDALGQHHAHPRRPVRGAGSIQARGARATVWRSQRLGHADRRSARVLKVLRRRCAELPPAGALRRLPARGLTTCGAARRP